MANPNEPVVDWELTSEATINDLNAGSSYAGAFFSNSRKFSVHGGIFTSNTHIHQAPSLPAGTHFLVGKDVGYSHRRRYDWTLLDNISGLVRRGSGPKLVRRMYTAKIDGKNSDMTVALYQGEHAEDEWKQSLWKVSGLRHPNLVQVYGTANSSGIYATILQDDLIPITRFFDLCRYSPILTVYIWAVWSLWSGMYGIHLVSAADLNVSQEAGDYLGSLSGRTFYVSDFILWIRRSSRRLCVDLARDEDVVTIWRDSPYYTDDLLTHGLSNLDQPNPEATAISSLTMEQYHFICSSYLPDWKGLPISSQEAGKLGSVISSSTSSERQKPVEIVFLSEVEVHSGHKWSWYDEGKKKTPPERMQDGWTRYPACGVVGREVSMIISINEGETWLSQANHIFSRLQITSNYEDFVFVEKLLFKIQISPTPQTSPEGFLFVCPLEDLLIGSTSFRWPDCPAYWSLDPAGVGRLSTAEADALGFASMELKTSLHGNSWNDSVYAGLRQFHEGKGFDAESQDVARHLGHRLYQLPENPDLPFAYVNDGDGESSYEEWFEVSSDANNNNYNQEEDFNINDEVTEYSNNANEDTSIKSEEADVQVSEIADNGIADESSESKDCSDGGLKGSNNGEPSQRSRYILDQEFNFVMPATEVASPGIYPAEESTIDYLYTLEADPACLSWNITMGVQLALILTLAIFSLYEHMYVQPVAVN